MGDEDTRDEELGAMLTLQARGVLHTLFILFELFFLLLSLDGSFFEVLQG